MDDILITFDNVSFAYEGEDEPKQVLHNVSLNIRKGEFVAVLGHNGSGKSTLAKLCNALYLPTSGKVTVKGITADSEENGDKIRRHVGMVFQNPDNQIVATIVEDDVAFGPENLGVEPKEIRERVDEALKKVKMYDNRLQEPHKLSGGQKQRVAIAGAMAMQNDCIIFDEPTAMLDPLGRKSVTEAICSLNKEQGKTVVLITHFMDEAALADRVVVLNSGRIVMNDTPKNVFSSAELLEKCGLEVPPVTKLCRELGIGQDIITMDECVNKIITSLGADK